MSSRRMKASRIQPEQSPDKTLHIYTRVSTVAQRDEGTSLQTQLELGKSRAKQLGFAYKHWDEGGKSSHHENIAERPTLNALFQSIKAGQVKHLFVYDQSRLSRNDSVASIFRYESDKQGVTLYTKDGQFDLSNPQDKFMKQILDGLSEFDNAIRSERTRLGKLSRARSGYWHGGPAPFGYTIQGKKLVVEKSEAAWVQRIFKAAHEGKSPLAIKLMLDSKGVSPRRGGMWSIGSVAALLKNTHYTGSYEYRDNKSGESVKIQCPSVVDPDLWKAVQLARIKKNSRTQQKNRTTTHFYLVRDLMYCGHCGRPISGRRKPSKAEALYYCPNKERAWVKNGGSKTPWKRGTGCGMDRSLNISATDKAIFELVQGTHRRSSILREEVKRRALAAQKTQHGRTASEVQTLEARIKRLQKQVAQAQDVLGAIEGNFDLGDVSKKTYEARRRTVKARVEELEVALSNAQLELKGSEANQRWVDWYKAYGDEVASKTNLTDEQKKEYIAGLVERIDVRYDRDSNEHQLTVQFRMPIVGDGIRWKDRSKKKLGYDLLKGQSLATVTLRKAAQNSPFVRTP